MPAIFARPFERAVEHVVIDAVLGEQFREALPLRCSTAAQKARSMVMGSWRSPGFFPLPLWERVDAMRSIADG